MSTQAQAFSLDDHHGVTHVYAFPRDLVTVLCFGDMVSAFQLASWIEPLYLKFRDQIDIVGIAAFRGVPELFRELVRTSIEKLSPKEVLIDWDGVVSEAYGLTFGQCRIVVIAPDGAMVQAVNGTATPASFQIITDAIAAQLAVPADLAHSR
ncbi:MAG: hypothetical protein SNJ67_03000 [Chloracidobacterium sp.]|uniref:Uncharacterized protein n=1 Tax=Chloracidobacterium validum TaxID=2821543 RepID=A0ABX8BB18_9BACT|nr:hypothetical protein [Chloracidobacterium validum]QUW02265.1 hypothetical protein J8C06_07810 [Chloracidobacterium validum]